MWVRAIRIGLIVMKWMRLNVTRVLGQKDVGQAEKAYYTEEALNIETENIKTVLLPSTVEIC
jgi:hypothetical protein